jgi:hypothetical protein
LQATQQGAPLSQFTDPQVRQVAPLSPLQQWAQGQIQQIPNMPGTTQTAANAVTGMVGQNPGQSALEQLAYLTGGPLGSAPATQAATQAWDQTQGEYLQNTLNTMGMGRSGAGAEQLNLSRTQALVPFLQQEVQNRATAVPQYLSALYTGTGQLENIGQQQQNALGTAATLGGAQGGVEQQTSQAALDAPLADWMRRQNLAQSVTTSLAGVPYSSPQTQTTQSRGGSFLGK